MEHCHNVPYVLNILCFLSHRNENYNQAVDPKPSMSGIKLRQHKVKTKLQKQDQPLLGGSKAAPLDEADSLVSHVAVKDSSSSGGDSPVSTCSDAENDTVRTPGEESSEIPDPLCPRKSPITNLVFHDTHF